MTTRIRFLILAAALVATAAVAAGASAAPGATRARRQPRRRSRRYLLDHTARSARLHEGVPGRREPLLRDREAPRLRLPAPRASSAAVRADLARAKSALDEGQPVLRARRGRRRRHAVARRLRRDPRRRLEREGGSGERRAVRPEAPERQGAPQAGQPLQPDRGHALGHAARVRRREGRPRRRRQARVRRGAARGERVQGGGGRVRPLRRQARPLGARVAPDRLGRVHRRSS